MIYPIYDPDDSPDDEDGEEGGDPSGCPPEPGEWEGCPEYEELKNRQMWEAKKLLGDTFNITLDDDIEYELDGPALFVCLKEKMLTKILSNDNGDYCLKQDIECLFHKDHSATLYVYISMKEEDEDDYEKELNLIEAKYHFSDWPNKGEIYKHIKETAITMLKSMLQAAIEKAML